MAPDESGHDPFPGHYPGNYPGSNTLSYGGWARSESTHIWKNTTTNEQFCFDYEEYGTEFEGTH